MNINCEIIRDLLPLYADNVCSEESRRLVESHCEGCGECRERLEGMRTPLPQKNCGGKNPCDPFKKARRHYIRLAVTTALIFTVIALPLLIIGKITLNEKMPRTTMGDISWSSMGAKRKMNDFGSLMKKGKYREAMDRVGFKGFDSKYYGGSEMDGVREGFAEDLGAIFEEYGHG